MRTTLDLPEELLNAALEITGIKTKTRVIIAALEELVRKESIKDLTKYKGKIDLNIDLDTLRGR